MTHASPNSDFITQARNGRRMRMSALVVGMGCVSVGLIGRPSPAQGGVQSRPMEVEDLFRSERVIEVVPSPDGAIIAVVVRRAATSSERYLQGGFIEPRGDVWLVHPDGTERRNLTNGVRDGSSYWMPTWSDDGEHLAMLSTKGGDGARLYVWSRRSGSLERAIDGSLDMMASANPHGGNWNRHPFAWIDAHRLAVMLLPTTKRPWTEGYETASLRGAMAVWPKSERGVEPTVSVLETGPGIKIPAPLGTLKLVDIETKRSSVLAEIPMEENASGQRSFVPSPSRRYAVVLSSERREFDPAQRRLTRSQSRHHIGIVSLDPAHPAVRWVDSLSAVVNVLFEHAIRWSPYDTAIVLLAKRASDLDSRSRMYAISAVSGTVRTLVPDDWDTSAPAIRSGEFGFDQANAVWTSDGRPVVYARPARGAAGGRPVRFDWWLIDGAASPRNLTASMSGVPLALNRTVDPRLLVGLANGRLWTLDVQTTKATDLAPALPRAREVAWPWRGNLPAETVGQIVIDVAESIKPDLYAITIGDTGPARRVAVPAWGGHLSGYVPSRSLALFNDTLSRAGASQGSGRTVDIISLNENLPPIEPPAQRLITYRGMDGDSLGAVIVFPNGYVPGRRYPMIARLYAGWTFRDTLILNDEVNEDLRLLAAHGYVVLVPSIPLKPQHMGSDPYRDIPKGVMPAVDRAIDLGIADPARLGFMGFSYGGFSAYSLLTATTRFRAAIAEQGPADLIADYGAFRPFDRYTDQPHTILANPKMAEDGQLRMGASPWGDLWRYLINSPLYYLDRVETPLLIIESDQDMVAMEQAERVFTGLQRLGKRVRLARYWGEWHVFDSPANIRDAWQRRFEWFDHYLGGPAPSTTAQH